VRSTPRFRNTCEPPASPPEAFACATLFAGAHADAADHLTLVHFRKEKGADIAAFIKDSNFALNEWDDTIDVLRVLLFRSSHALLETRRTGLSEDERLRRQNAVMHINRGFGFTPEIRGLSGRQRGICGSSGLTGEARRCFELMSQRGTQRVTEENLRCLPLCSSVTSVVHPSVEGKRKGQWSHDSAEERPWR